MKPTLFPIALIMSLALFISDGMACMTIPSFQDRNDRFQMRIGTRILKKNPLTDLWGVDKENLENIGLELGYERIFLNFLSIEINVGGAKTVESLFFSRWTTIDIVTFYATQDFKCYLPLGSRAAAFAGTGFDLYYDPGHITYTSDDGVNYQNRRDSSAWGRHFQAGVEYLIDDNPAAEGLYDLPVSLEIRYEYYWIGFNDSSRRVMSGFHALGDILTESKPSRIAGHTLSVGLKWLF